MSRKEFTRETKRAALARSGHKCEATGPRYGFEEGQRCNCDLSLGVQFDHVQPCALGGDNSLDNAKAVCVQCHKYATRNDVRQIRKGDRQRDKNAGVIRPSGKLKSPSFPKSSKPKVERKTLPPRPLYQEPPQ